MNPTGQKLHVYMIPKASAVLPYITQYGTFSASTHSTLILKKKEATYLDMYTHTHTHTHTINTYIHTYKLIYIHAYIHT